MDAVLFLDHAYRPLSVEGWQEAIKDIFLGKVELIERSRDRTIRTVSRAYPMPSVVRVIRPFKRSRIAVKFSRLNVYTRDGFRCMYCGAQKFTEDLTFDHVVPRAQGGKTTWENIVSSCEICNRKKDNRTPEQAGMRLRKKPVKPHFLPVVSVKLDRQNVPKEWVPYWSVALTPD